MAAVVLVVAGIGLRVGVPIYQQQRAIREIERVGGRVETENGRPVWLWRLAGDDLMTPFAAATSIDLSNSHANDAILAHAGQLRTARRLLLGDNVVTDAGLARIGGLTDLVELRLPGSQITDAGLTELVALSQLYYLDLARTRVSDAGVPTLCKLKEQPGSGLYLDLRGTQISDAGIDKLKKALPHVRIAR